VRPQSVLFAVGFSLRPGEGEQRANEIFSRFGDTGQSRKARTAGYVQDDGFNKVVSGVSRSDQSAFESVSGLSKKLVTSMPTSFFESDLQVAPDFRHIGMARSKRHAKAIGERLAEPQFEIGFATLAVMKVPGDNIEPTSDHKVQ